MVRSARLLLLGVGSVFAISCSGGESGNGRAENAQPVPTDNEIALHVASLACVKDFSKYWSYAPNKAFASSPDGSCGWSGAGMSSPEFAAASALRFCEVGREREKHIAPCKVVNINGAWQ